MKNKLEYEFQFGSCHAQHKPKELAKSKLASWLVLASMVLELGG